MLPHPVGYSVTSRMSLTLDEFAESVGNRFSCRCACPNAVTCFYRSKTFTNNSNCSFGGPNKVSEGSSSGGNPIQTRLSNFNSAMICSTTQCKNTTSSLLRSQFTSRWVLILFCLVSRFNHQYQNVLLKSILNKSHLSKLGHNITQLLTDTTVVPLSKTWLGCFTSSGFLIVL